MKYLLAAVIVLGIISTGVVAHANQHTQNTITKQTYYTYQLQPASNFYLPGIVQQQSQGDPLAELQNANFKVQP